MWQEPHSLKVSPKVAAVRAEGPGCPSFVSVVDAHTGKEVDSLSAGISVSQVLSCPAALPGPVSAAVCRIS